MSDIHSLMEACYEQGASDLHVSVGRPPVLRRHGHLVEIEGRASLTGADVDAMVAEITPERIRESWDNSSGRSDVLWSQLGELGL